MKKFLYTPLLLLVLGFSQAIKADTLGVWVGGGLWDWDVSGTFRYQSTNVSDTVNVGNSGSNYLNWGNDDSGTVFAIIEHPVPVIPNVKFFSTSLETSGTGQATITYGGATLADAVTSSLKMDITDVTLYWSFLDNVVGLDLGIMAKNIDGKLTITDVTSPAQTDTANFSTTLPLLYAGLDVSLPLTGLTLGANAAYIGYDGSSVTDFHAYLRYDSSLVLGAEVGVKKFKIELDDIDQSYGELEFSGVYAMLFLHF